MSIGAVRAFTFSLASALCIFAAPLQAGGPDVPFESLAREVFNGGPRSLAAYTRLEDEFRRLTENEQRSKAQILATADTILGDYVAAEERNLRAFGPVKAQPCPVGYALVPAQNAIADVARIADILLFNELHTRPSARVFLSDMLPILRDHGYGTLALEALFSVSDERYEGQLGLPLADPELAARGTVRDDATAGIYLREPRFAALVRHALKLGFTLVSYDPPDAYNRDEREQGQADNLALLKASVNEKIVVLAGGSHIWKSGGWMAERLVSKNPELHVVSVDLVSGSRGCSIADDKFLPAPAQPPIAFKTPNGRYWSDQPARTDLTVFMHLGPKRNGGAGWLSDWGRLTPVRMDRSECRQGGICLIEAYRPDDLSSVPVDRSLLREGDPQTHLYLPTSDYVIRIVQAGSREAFLLRVR